MLSAEVEFSDVEAFFMTLNEYDRLPQSWPGFRIEQWVRSRQVDEAFAKADEVMSKMLDEVKNEQA